MTADQERAPTLPPRWFVRTAWVLHRAAYRLTRGRFGLWQSEVGGRFGTLRSRTIGRRIGRPRVAIVDFAVGHRAVRARAAAGEERARLWARFRDYRGRGDDLDAVASIRSTEPAVVVLEPRNYVDVSPAKDNQGATNG